MSDSKNPPDVAKVEDAPHAGSAAGKPAPKELLSALTATDVTIRRLDLLLSTAGGQERVLATTQYVASILSHLSASAPWIALQTRLGLLARLKGAAPSHPAKPSAIPARFQALASLASETRYSIRLFGLLPLWIWGSETLKSPPADPVLRALTVLQIISNVIYQLLENVAYLASKGVVSKRFIEKYGGINKWYIWSTRGWFGHIFFQFFVLWRQHVLRKKRAADSDAARDSDAASKTGSKEIQTQDPDSLRAEIHAWRKSLVNNSFWAPLCVHWCLEKGIGIPDGLHGLISFGAGAWALHDMWGATSSV